MTTLLSVVTNRPGGLIEVSEMDWYEGESISLTFKLTEIDGVSPIDCTGWSVEQAGVYSKKGNPTPGDLGVGMIATLSASGVLSVVSTATPAVGGESGTFPAGRKGWWFVRVTRPGFGDVFLVEPSPIRFLQAPTGA